MKTFICLVMLLAGSAAFGDGFSEVPLRLYGKVLNVATGTSHQLFDGELTVTLTPEGDSQQALQFSTSLGPRGIDGAFSYFIEIPQQYLPTSGESNEKIAVSSASQRYLISAVRIDGFPATPLDRELSILSTSFAERGKEVRFDLQVTLELIDTDGDRMPDWWEELYGLNPLFGGDASDDIDADGILNVDEFKGGTDPNTSNAEPTVVSNTIAAPEGGSAGLALTIVDSDSAPADLELTVLSGASGLAFRSTSGPLTPPFTFSYADVLAGEVVIDVAFGTTASTVPMTVTDTAGSITAHPFNLFVNTFSPGSPGGPQPAVWLEPAALAGDLSEWPDGSANNRDGYQPSALSQPAGSASGVDFDGAGEFLYLDDRRLALPNLTAFFAFNADALTSADQVLFHGGGFDLRIGGSLNPMHSSTLLATRNGQLIEGPAVSFGTGLQVTVTGDPTDSILAVDGASLFASAATAESLAASFATIGAARTIQQGSASQFFDGRIEEVILYDTPLDAAQRSRLEEYQLSRWSGMVIWDARNATARQLVSGHPGVRNVLNGGWGDDALQGAELADVLRGGPGRDRLTGNAGGDRFQIFSGHNDDTVTDFSEVAGDILDLTPIFTGVPGTPDHFLNLRTETVRDGGGVPTINTVLEIDYDGGLDDVDQSLTLEGVALGNADLRRLVGSGTIQLGGPRFAAGVTLVSAETQILETTAPRSITVERSGNTEGAAEISLGFTGSATVDEDYLLAGLSGTGAVRTVVFAEGETQRTITITPVQDTFDETEEILVTVLPSSQFSSLPTAPMALSLEDAPAVSISVLRRYAERLGAVPAIVQLHRTGDLSGPLDIELQFTGSAQNGRDFNPVSPLLTFPTGVATVEIEVTPSPVSPVEDRPVIAQLGIVPDTTRFAVESPWTGSVMIVDAVSGDAAQTFASFRAEHFPGNTDSDAVLGASDPDGDFLNTLGEYLFGTDPNVADPVPEIGVKRFNSGGFIEILLTTAAGITDAGIELQFSTDLVAWSSVKDGFTVAYHWLTDGRVRRVYRSRLSANNLNDAGYYVAAVSQLQPANLDATASSAIGAAGQPLLAVSGPVWLPSADGTQLDAPQVQTSDPSVFSTYVDGAFDTTFEWSADPGHRLTFEIDGMVVETATATAGFVTVNHSLAEPGHHELRWTVERLAGTATPTEPEALRGLEIVHP